MLGGAEPYDRIPYFYSDQYDLGMEYTGPRRPRTSSSSAAAWPIDSSSRSGSPTAESSPG
jgi:hypothetical protein